MLLLMLHLVSATTSPQEIARGFINRSTSFRRNRLMQSACALRQLER